MVFIALVTVRALPAKAGDSYRANCKEIGDSIVLTSTGEAVLEQRLINFKLIEKYKAQSGARGVCLLKK